MWDPESDDDYRVRWWLAMLGVPWLRTLIIIGFGAGFFSLVFLPPILRDGTAMSSGERVIQLALLTLVGILALRIDRRRRRERAMRSADDDADTRGREDDRPQDGGAERERSPASSRWPEQ